jgi:hypothetical protein
MESNLDDEYYQKYIQYKHKYNMLKQLKNNYNDLEGGSSGIFGWGASTPTEAPASAPAEAPAEGESQVSPVAPVAPEIDSENDPATDGTYLLFNVNQFMLTKPDSYDYVKKFVQNYHNDEANKDGLDFIDKTIFKGLFTDNAYILVKTGRSYTYTIISDDRDLTFLDEYTKINTLADTLPNEPCDCKKNNLSISIDETMIINNAHLKKKYDEIKMAFTNKKRNYVEAEAASDRILETVLNIKTDIGTILNDPIINLYNDNKFSFTTASLTVANNRVFLSHFNNEIYEKIMAIRQVDMSIANKLTYDMNMIIKIKPSYESDTHYKFDEYIRSTSVSNTDMYTQIDKIVANNREIKYKQRANEQVIVSQPLYNNQMISYSPGMPMQGMQMPMQGMQGMQMPMQGMQGMQGMQMPMQGMSGFSSGFMDGYRNTMSPVPMGASMPMQSIRTMQPMSMQPMPMQPMPMQPVSMGTSMQMQPISGMNYTGVSGAPGAPGPSRFGLVNG